MPDVHLSVTMRLWQMETKPTTDSPPNDGWQNRPGPGPTKRPD